MSSVSGLKDRPSRAMVPPAGNRSVIFFAASSFCRWLARITLSTTVMGAPYFAPVSARAFVSLGKQLPP